MLNLALPNFAFVVAFAVKGMGWQASSVGLMAALPHLCNCLQPVCLAALSRRYSKYAILLLTFSLGGLPWLLAPCFPFLGEPVRDVLFALVLLVATFATSVVAVARSSAISELVPERLGSRYFAKRNLIFGAWTLLAVLLAGHAAEWGHNSLTVFGWIFFLAGLSRLMGLFFLTRMTFPRVVKEKRSRGIALEDLVSVLRTKNYMWLCLFVGSWGLFLNMGMPFYTVFMVRQLELGVGDVVILTTLASLGGLVTLKGWGRLSERFGNRPILTVCALAWGATGFGMWGLARPGQTYQLYLGYFIVGATTADFQLAQFNLMLRLARASLRPAFVAVFLASTSLLAAAGPVLGGQMLKLLPGQLGSPPGYVVFDFHVVFAISAAGCILASRLLRNVQEPAAGEVTSVWCEMRTMRTFNPMLSVLSVGELLLTPRGLFALGKRSLRSVRQQVKALEEVGEEIVSGGLEVLGGPGSAASKDASRNRRQRAYFNAAQTRCTSS